MNTSELVRRNMRYIVDKYEDGNASAFARTLGVTRQAVSNYLNGWRTPDIEFVALVCRTYHVSPDWMLLGERYE